VVAAVDDGSLDPNRLDSWRRLRRELAYLERKTDGTAATAERAKWKSVAKLVKAMYKDRSR
jgi:ribosome biogenesis GTPase